MRTMRLVVCLVALIYLSSCGSDSGGINPNTPYGTPVNLTAFNALFKGYTSQGKLHLGTQLRFGNMTGTVRFNNLTGARSHGKCTGSYTINAVGPTVFETQQVTESTTALELLTGPTSPQSIMYQRYFLVSNGYLYKFTNAPGTLSYVPAYFSMPPNPANVGDFGKLAILDGSDGSTLTIDWELNPEFFGNSIMIITSTTADILNAVTAIEVDKFYLDRFGNTFKFDVTFTSGGITITMAGNKT